MSTSQERLNEIEIMLVHQERTIEELSQIVQSQWAEIDRLKAKLKQTEGKIETLETEGRPAADQKPPHY